MTYYGSNLTVAQFVSALLQVLPPGLQLITITKTGSSEDWYVRIVTDGSLDDIVKRTAQTYCLQPMNI